MSRFSAVDPNTGGYGDIVCRKFPPTEGWYNVFVGGTMIGQVAHDATSGWTAISNARPDRLRGWRSTRGFGRRWDAIEYLLRACGIWQGGDYVPPLGQEYIDPGH